MQTNTRLIVTLIALVALGFGRPGTAMTALRSGDTLDALIAQFRQLEACRAQAPKAHT